MVQPGQIVTVLYTFNGRPAAPGNISWTTRRTGNASYWMSSTAGELGTPGTSYWMSPLSGGILRTTQYPEEAEACPCPTNGILSELWVNLAQDPGAGKTVSVTVRVGKVSTALTLTITGNGATHKAAHYTTPIAIAQGHLVDYKVTFSAGSTAPPVQIGVMFTPIAPGECVYMYALDTTPGAAVYGWGASPVSTAETDVEAILTDCTITKVVCDFYASLRPPSGPPAALAKGQLAKFRLRRNAGFCGTPGVPGCVLRGNGVTTEVINNADSTTYVTGDRAAIQMVVDSEDVIFAYGLTITIPPITP